MSVANLVNQIEAPRQLSAFSASELAGELVLNPAWASYAAADLPELCAAFGERLRETLFDLGDVALWHLHYVGAETPAARIKALDELAAAAMIERPFLRRAVHVARAFPVALREQYPDKPLTWYELLTERTAAPGDTPAVRQERRERLARECSELNCRELRERIDAELRPAPASNGATRGEFLELDEPAPHPATVAETPPEQQAELCVEDVAPVLVAGLLARLKREQPGTFPLVVECVRDHLAAVLLEQPWRITVSA